MDHQTWTWQHKWTSRFWINSKGTSNLNLTRNGTCVCVHDQTKWPVMWIFNFWKNYKGWVLTGWGFKKWIFTFWGFKKWVFIFEQKCIFTFFKTWIFTKKWIFTFWGRLTSEYSEKEMNIHFSKKWIFTNKWIFICWGRRKNDYSETSEPSFLFSEMNLYFSMWRDKALNPVNVYIYIYIYTYNYMRCVITQCDCRHTVHAPSGCAAPRTWHALSELTDCYDVDYVTSDACRYRTSHHWTYTCMHAYIYIYIYMHNYTYVSIYIYIHIYLYRERERERDPSTIVAYTHVYIIYTHIIHVCITHWHNGVSVSPIWLSAALRPAIILILAHPPATQQADSNESHVHTARF